MIMMNTDFCGLVKRISPVLRRITCRLGAHHAAFNHEDLYQEAVMHLWEDFNAGKISDKTDSYLLQGCYFHLKNFIRKNKSKNVAVSIDSLFPDDNGSQDCSYLLEDKAAGDFMRRINDNLLAETIRNNGFTPREKGILELVMHDMTTRQIGGKLGISHVMVVKIMKDIRRKSRVYADTE